MVLVSFMGCAAKKAVVGNPSPLKNESEQEQVHYVQKAVDHVIVAAIYEAQGDYLRSINEYNQALLHDSSSTTLYSLIAENYMQLGELESAQLILERGINNSGEDIELIRLLADVSYDLKQYPEARTYYQQVLAINPDDEDAWYNLATIYVMAGDHVNAVAAYDRVLQLSGPDVDIMVRQATLLTLLADYDRAITVYENLRSMRKKDHLIPFTIGSLYLQKEDLKTADSLFQIASSMAPGVSRYWSMQLQIAALENDTSKALNLVSQALTNVPDDLDLLSLAGNIYLRFDLFEDAEVVMLEAVERDTTSNVHLINLGFLYHEMKQWEKAETIYKSAVERDPDDPQLLNNYAYLLAEKGERFEDALELVNRALAKEPDQASFLDTKGWLLFLMGRQEQALDPLKRAVELDAENPEILFHLGDLYNGLGERDLAEKYYTRALDNGADKAEILPKLEKLR
ncbi:tetratricopeptide repeat protein [bacterium]|nr:tetratricopeptide repeat protein [bacterium]